MTVISIHVTIRTAQELAVNDGQKLFQPSFVKANGNVSRNVVREILDELPPLRELGLGRSDLRHGDGTRGKGGPRLERKAYG